MYEILLYMGWCSYLLLGLLDKLLHFCLSLTLGPLSKFNQLKSSVGITFVDAHFY